MPPSSAGPSRAIRVEAWRWGSQAMPEAATTVSDPPSSSLRAAPNRRRAAPAGSASSESITTTASPPRSATRLARSTASSAAWVWASTDSSKLPPATETSPSARFQSVTSSGRTPTSATLTLQAAGAAERARPARAAAGWRRRRGRRRRPRGSPWRWAPRPIASGHRQLLGGVHRGQVREQRPLLGRLGVAAVDLLDADQRGVLLVAAGGAHPPGDVVAAAQLAAADLGRRDVDVGVLVAAGAQEAAAVGQHVQDARRPASRSESSRSSSSSAESSPRSFRRRPSPWPAWDRRRASGRRRPAVAPPGRALGLVGLHIRVGVLVVTAVGGLGGLAALGADDGRHQIVTAQAAEALDSELRGDRVEIGQRALLEFALLQDCHLVRLLLGSKWDAEG